MKPKNQKQRKTFEFRLSACFCCGYCNIANDTPIKTLSGYMDSIVRPAHTYNSDTPSQAISPKTSSRNHEDTGASQERPLDMS